LKINKKSTCDSLSQGVLLLFCQFGRRLMIPGNFSASPDVLPKEYSNGYDHWSAWRRFR
jgi:hypothetical protein